MTIKNKEAWRRGVIEQAVTLGVIPNVVGRPAEDDAQIEAMQSRVRERLRRPRDPNRPRTVFYEFDFKRGYDEVGGIALCLHFANGFWRMGAAFRAPGDAPNRGIGRKLARERLRCFQPETKMYRNRGVIPVTEALIDVLLFNTPRAQWARLPMADRVQMVAAAIATMSAQPDEYRGKRRAVNVSFPTRLTYRPVKKDVAKAGLR